MFPIFDTETFFKVQKCFQFKNICISKHHIDKFNAQCKNNQCKVLNIYNKDMYICTYVYIYIYIGKDLRTPRFHI